MEFRRGSHEKISREGFVRLLAPLLAPSHIIIHRFFKRLLQTLERLGGKSDDVPDPQYLAVERVTVGIVLGTAQIPLIGVGDEVTCHVIPASLRNRRTELIAP